MAVVGIARESIFPDLDPNHHVARREKRLRDLGTPAT